MKVVSHPFFCLSLCQVAVVALQQPAKPFNTRRAFFKSTLSTAAASITLVSPALADGGAPTAGAPKPAEEKKAVVETKPAAKPADSPKKEEKAVVAEKKKDNPAEPKKEEKKVVAEAPKTKDENSFVGSYTDPNHPGGKTSIRLTGQRVGEYALAEVIGGGGKNEPASYTLPAVLMGERTIFIDFTSKGGPRNFVGFLNKDGDVDFLKDGNRWSRI